jgi:hypothetical protein
MEIMYRAGVVTLAAALFFSALNLRSEENHLTNSRLMGGGSYESCVASQDGTGSVPLETDSSLLQPHGDFNERSNVFLDTFTDEMMDSGIVSRTYYDREEQEDDLEDEFLDAFKKGVGNELKLRIPEVEYWIEKGSEIRDHYLTLRTGEKVEVEEKGEKKTVRRYRVRPGMSGLKPYLELPIKDKWGILTHTRPRIFYNKAEIRWAKTLRNYYLDQLDLRFSISYRISGDLDASLGLRKNSLSISANSNGKDHGVYFMWSPFFKGYRTELIDVLNR